MKRTVWILILVPIIAGVSVVSYEFGRFVEMRSERGSSKQLANSLTTLNALGAYAIQAKISEHLDAGNNSEAKCLSDLTASAYSRTVRSCLSQPGCGPLVAKEVSRDAPELLSKNNSRFKYYEDGEFCAAAGP